MIRAGILLAALIVLPAGSFAEPGRIELPEGIIVRPHAYGHFEAGQIGSGSLKASDAGKINGPDKFKIDHVWTENALVSFGMEALYRDYAKMVFSMYTKLYFSYPQQTDEKYTKNSRQDVAIDEVFAQYHYGDPAVPLFLCRAGYFKFKYNPQVRNLGEYLFRTGTYPVYFDMWFDFPQQRLLGFHGQSNPMQALKLDLLFVSATSYPTMNWSLAALASYDVADLHFLEVGAGIDFANLFSVYTNHTFPVMFGGDPTTPGGTFNDQYIDNGDTAYYTFKGTKLMGRICFDPKPFLPWKNFGDADLKLYAEACIVGLKNYPDSGYTSGVASGSIKQRVAPSYNKLLEKMPVAVGINLPAFNVLDIVNFELEWFGAKYYNDATMLMNQGSKPLPNVNVTPSPNQPAKSQIKWSAYAKKSFFDNHFAVTGQVGRDHLRLPTAAYNFEMYNELLVSSEDWWWVLKTNWMF
jgi:hypothetical protein